jgi:hypothetical protein
MCPIEGLSTSRRLPRLGKIHLGVKDDRGIPKRTDYFVFDKDNPHYKELVDAFGEKPKELRIMIPVEDEERFASQYYRCYSKTRGLICKGDGITASRLTDTASGAMADRDSKEVEMREIECKGRDCPDYKQKCKEVMNLQFLLPEIPGLGVWQIDTSSINSIININSMVGLLKAIYKKISMIPLLLTLEPKPVKNPDDGKVQTVFVLNLRVNEKLSDLARLARKSSEIYELPLGDADRPELIAPDWEGDAGAPKTMPDLTPEEVKELEQELWGNGKPKELEKPEEKPKIKKAPAKEKPTISKEPEVIQPGEDFPEGSPSQMTLGELLELAKEKGWSLTDIGQYCNAELHWGVTVRSDIDTPERINTLAQYISENPKK